MEFSQNENILSIKNEMNIEFVFCGNIKTKWNLQTKKVEHKIMKKNNK
jgi:hypothetical protein